MVFEELNIQGVKLIKPEIFSDQRGYFFETFHKEKFSQAGIKLNVLQQNQSGSTRGILRGLHYQIKHTQGKLVRAIHGEIFDVAVDLRKSSQTFGKWLAVQLSEVNKYQLWIPPGFAHGYYVLSDWAEITYATSDVYAPNFERTILWNDPEIGITWPVEKNSKPILSEKDKSGLRLKDAELFE